MASRNFVWGTWDGTYIFEFSDNRGIDVYSSRGELINHFSEPELITAVPAVVQFHPRKEWIVAGTASGKVVAYGLPESAD